LPGTGGPSWLEEAVLQRVGRWCLAAGLLLALAACDHGDVPALRERAQQAWSEVQTQYSQRADHVPPLVEAVRKKAPAEREVLDEVMAAHEEVVAIRNAQQRLSDALEKLYATIKRYPELTGDTALQNRLHEFQRQEDRLVVARSDLISAVRTHNEELRGFPGGWVAAVLNPRAKALTTFAQAEMEQPPVPARP
jgi:LemA protein